MFPTDPNDFWWVGPTFSTPSELRAKRTRPHESPECKCDGCMRYDVAEEASRRPETD